MTKDPQLTDCVDFELFAVQVAGITHLAALPYTSAGEAEVEKRMGGSYSRCARFDISGAVVKIERLRQTCSWAMVMNDLAGPTVAR